MNRVFSYDVISFCVERFGSREAVYDYDAGRHYSYRQMEERSQRLSRYLIEELKLKKGDCIAFCSANTTAFLDALVSGYRTGIIITTYNPRLTKDELLELVKKETPKVLFFEDCFVEKAKCLMDGTSIKKCISLFGPVDWQGCEFYDNMLIRQEIPYLWNQPLDHEDIQMYIHTGGTTGLPKTAMLSYRCTFFNAIGAILSDGINSKDSSLIFLPFFHTSGWNVLTIPLLFCGGRVILERKFDPQKALKIIREERPTAALGVPSIFQGLANHPDFEITDFSCFRWISNGGMPPVREAMERFWDKGVKLVNGYGMTEIGPNNLRTSISGLEMEDVRELWNVVGEPGYFNLVKIIDENGKEVSSREKGELCFKGPLTFSGYLGNEVETEKMVREGWVSTGDIGWQDDKGHYHIAGRKKNMFITCGENIFPTEIETILRRFHTLLDVCVIGVPDAERGEVGKMILVVDQGFSFAELKAFIKKNLPTIKRPKYFDITDRLPVNENGKPELTKIKEMYTKGGFPVIYDREKRMKGEHLSTR